MINLNPVVVATRLPIRKKRLVWEHITERVNALGVARRSTKEIKTKWSNLHQEAKKAYTENTRDSQKTGGGPPPKPLSATAEKIVEIYKDCPSFTGLQGVESLIEEDPSSVACTLSNPALVGATGTSVQENISTT